MTRITEYQNAGFTFDVIDSGPEDGTPIVLLHGFPQRATSWQHVSAELNAAGYRTYAPDQRGYSPRARPRSRFGYRIPRLVEDVEALIDRIGTPVHLVGHDWGAAVGWVLAAQRPDVVLSYTAVSVPHTAAFLRSMLGTQIFKSYYMLLFQLPFLPRWLLSRPAGRRFLAGAGMTREMIATYQREIVEDGALQGGLGWYRSLPLAPPGDATRKVSVPTTLVWSDGDIALGRKGTDLCERYVTGPYTLEVLEGVSHWIPDERPQDLARFILDRVTAG